MGWYQRDDYITVVNGKEVFTKKHIIERERYMMCIIDRIETMAAAALVFSIIALIAVLAG